MYIKSLHIEGFRCFQDISATFDPKLTILVGENSTGKSTVGLAITKFFNLLIGRANISIEDYPYGIAGPMIFEITIGLQEKEVKELLIDNLIPNDLSDEKKSLLRNLLLQQGDNIRISMRYNTHS